MLVPQQAPGGKGRTAHLVSVSYDAILLQVLQRSAFKRLQHGEPVTVTATPGGWRRGVGSLGLLG
jgi:hypothetical protein